MQAESLKKKGMSLYRKDRDRCLELLKYQVQLSDQKYWENRKKYFFVMNNLINGKLTAEDFIDEFLRLCFLTKICFTRFITNKNIFKNCKIWDEKNKKITILFESLIFAQLKFF